jgi:hypothetical protein
MAHFREQARLGKVGFQSLVARQAQGIMSLLDGGNIPSETLKPYDEIPLINKLYILPQPDFASIGGDGGKLIIGRRYLFSKAGAGRYV